MKKLAMLVLTVVLISSCGKTVYPNMSGEDIGELVDPKSKYEIISKSGSKVTGRISEVKNDTIYFSAKNYDLPIPVERIAKLKEMPSTEETVTFTLLGLLAIILIMGTISLLNSSFTF